MSSEFSKLISQVKQSSDVPSNPVAGEEFFDTDTNYWMRYDGSMWRGIAFVASTTSTSTTSTSTTSTSTSTTSTSTSTTSTSTTSTSTSTTSTSTTSSSTSTTTTSTSTSTTV